MVVLHGRGNNQFIGTIKDYNALRTLDYVTISKGK